MAELDVPALFTADPINIGYATGARNMTVYAMMGAVRFLLVIADGPAILWEFAGSEHLAERIDTIDEVRTASGVTAVSGPDYAKAIDGFAAEIAEACADHAEARARLAVERVDHLITDALRETGFVLSSATEVFVQSRMIKLPEELAIMRTAMSRVIDAVASMEATIQHGTNEVEVWSEFHRGLIASEGEYVSTRLAQSGAHTFPYYQEAGTHRLVDGDLFCIDTDAIGFGGYAVDFSRTFVCGDKPPPPQYQSLHDTAREQLCHNAALLAPGLSFKDFSARCWKVPDRVAPYSYNCVAHGLGMSGEYPYVPAHQPDVPFPLGGHFEPGMVMCVESYVGDADLGRGVKLEDQYLITDHGAELLSTAPHL